MKPPYLPFSPAGRLAVYALLLGLALLLARAGHAQPAVVLRGQVLDAETHQPIPHAQIGIAGNQLGTSANAEGFFALAVPAAYRTSSLEVAALGYRRYTQPVPPLPGPALRIVLRPSPAALGAVTVSGSVLGIVRQAVARIPQNYPVRPTRLTGFYRESDNSLATSKYRYLIEGLLLVVKAGYQHPDDRGQVQLLESRKALLETSAFGGVGWLAGPFIPHRFDVAHQRPEFLQEAHFADYLYRLARQSCLPRPASVRGRVHPAARQPPRRLRRPPLHCRGQLRHPGGRVAPDGQRHPPRSFRDAQLHGARAVLPRRLPALRGRYHLKSVQYLTRGEPLTGDSLRHLSEYVTTAIDTAQAAPLSYQQRAQYQDVFLQNTVRYDSAFWQQHTTLLPSADLRLAFDSLRQVQAAQVFRAKPGAATPGTTSGWAVRLLGRLHYVATIGPLPLTVPTAALAVDFAAGGAGFRAQAATDLREQALTYLRCSAMRFDLAPHWQLHYADYAVLRQLTGGGWEAGLTYAHNLNPHHRPLTARLGVSYASLRIARELGTYNNTDDNLRLAGTHLSADELSLQLQTRTEALLPRLGLGVELSHKLELLADLGYLVPLRTRTQLRVAEESGFSLTRQSATLNLPATEVSLQVVGQPTTAAPWQLQHLLFSVGLAYRFCRNLTKPKEHHFELCREISRADVCNDCTRDFSASSK